MTNSERAALKKRIDDEGLQTVARKAGVSGLTLAKVLAAIKVNANLRASVERYAAGLVSQ